MNRKNIQYSSIHPGGRGGGAMRQPMLLGHAYRTPMPCRPAAFSATARLWQRQRCLTTVVTGCTGCYTVSAADQHEQSILSGGNGSTPSCAPAVHWSDSPSHLRWPSPPRFPNSQSVAAGFDALERLCIRLAVHWSISRWGSAEDPQAYQTHGKQVVHFQCHTTVLVCGSTWVTN